MRVEGLVAGQRFRCAVPVFCTLLLVVSVGYSAVLFAIHHEAITGIQRETQHVAASVAEAAKDGVLPKPLPTSNELHIQVLGPDRKVLTSSISLLGWSPMAIGPPPRGFAEREVCGPGRDCLLANGMRVTDRTGRDLVIIAARPTPPFLSQPGSAAFIGGIALFVVLFGAGGIWFAMGRSMRRIERIRADLAMVAAANLGGIVGRSLCGNLGGKFGHLGGQLGGDVTARQRRGSARDGPDGDEIGRLANTVQSVLSWLGQRRFIADASHELRSPLAGMHSRIEVALLHPSREGSAEVLQKLLADVNRLEAILADLSMLTHLDNGRDHSMDRGDLTAVVSRELAERQPREGIVIIEEAPDIAPVRCSEVELRRLLVNLVDNAERHASGRVRVQVTAGSETTRLEVTDDGTGIALEDRERIFERFTRLREALDREPKGTGLGLAIAHELATAHGGTLTVKDGLFDTGARFVLELPTAPDPPTPGRCSPASGPGR